MMPLVALMALFLTATCAKRLGDGQTIERPPADTSYKPLVAAQRRNQSHSAPRTPLGVFTLPVHERVSLSPLGIQSLVQVYNACAAYDEYAREVFAGQAVYKQLGYLKYSSEMRLKYYLVKATWSNAQTACAADGAALYTFTHSVQLDATLAEFYPLLAPWVDIKKAGAADNASSLCGFLNAPAPGKSSLQWDDCLTLHDFICEKTASTSKTANAQAAVATFRTSSIASRQVQASQTAYMAQFLDAYLTLANTYIPLIDPILDAATSYTSFLTAAEVTKLQRYPNTKQRYFQEMAAVISMLNANEILTPTQMQQVQSALALGSDLFDITGSVVSSLAPEFNLSPVQISTVADMTTQADIFYAKMREVFMDANLQPNPTAAQITVLQDSYLASQPLVDQAVTVFSTLTTPTTTPATTTTAAPELPLIPKYLQDLLNQILPLTGYLRELFNIVMSRPALLTNAEKAQIQDIFQKLNTLSLQDVIVFLSRTTAYQAKAVPLTTLSTSEMQQTQTAVQESIYIYANTIGLISALAPKYPDLFSPVMQQVTAVIAAEHFGVLSIMEDVFSNVNVQPTLTTVQETRIQQYLYKAQAFLSGLPLGTLPPPIAPPMSPPLAKHLQDYLTQTLIYSSFMELILAKAATNPGRLTPTQVSQVQDYFTQCQNFQLTDVITMLATTPTLTPAQMQRAKSAVDQVHAMLSTAATLIDPLATIFQYTVATKQATIAAVNQGLSFYALMQNIFSNPNVQPTITPAQEVQIQAIIAPNQRLVSAIVASANVATSPNASPLTKYLRTLLSQAQTSYNLLLPVLTTATRQTLTLKHTAQLHAILTHADSFLYDLFPSMIAMVDSNTSLTPEQIRQLRDAVAQGVNLFSNIEHLINRIASRLNLNAAQRKAIADLTDVNENMFGTLLRILLGQNGTPTVSAAQLQQLAVMAAYSESIIAGFGSTFSATPTVTVPTSTTPSTPSTTHRPRPTRPWPWVKPWMRPQTTTPPSHGGQDSTVISRIEKRLIVARIAGLVAELEALMAMWRLHAVGGL